MKFIYDPCDAKVECFGIELTIRNKDINMVKYLWSEQRGKWTEKHLGFVLEKCLEEHFDQGFSLIMRSENAHAIFNSLNPEDKDQFLGQDIIDKVLKLENWESNQLKFKSQQKQLQIVIDELSYDPYGPYACLRFPHYFNEYGHLESCITRVKEDHISEFVYARQDNYNALL